MAGMMERGALHPLTLRYLDDELEAEFQRSQGDGGRIGYRIVCGASALLWALAAFLIPMGTAISASTALSTAGLMSLASVICYMAAPWAHTLNRQHGLIGLLTSANGLVILALASAGGALQGYAVAAIMLLFSYAFFSRTRFVFAAFRTAVIGVGFAYAVATYRGEGSLVIDSFLFVAASLGTGAALRRLEKDRRQGYHQELVIAEQARELAREQEETERLLLNILPASVSARLRRGDSPIADNYPSVSVLFADIVGFTPLSARLSAFEVIDLLSELFVCFDQLVEERGLEKIKTIGDAYMAAGGLPDPLEGHAIRIVDLGLAMLRETERICREPELHLRVGVHSGPAAGGVIGRRKFAFDVWGDTVNVASRLEEHGVPGRVHISAATSALLEGRFLVEARGLVDLRGHGPIETFLIAGPVPEGIGTEKLMAPARTN
jgi:class 3 adenylate cyclase